MAHKYHAKPTTVDGIRFASQLEARYYGDLLILAKAGKVECVELQPRYPLNVRVGDTLFLLGEYRADFRFYDMTTGALRVVDCKGLDTPLSKWKRKHTEAQYGITVELYPPRRRHNDTGKGKKAAKKGKR